MLDKLTGLYMRKYFLDQLDLEVKRCQRYRRPLSVLALELEYAYFHPGIDVRWSMGYTLFKQLGPLVLSTLRNVDLAARYEGEIFACFLPETGVQGAEIAAERLRSRIEKHWFLGHVPGTDPQGTEERFRVAMNVGVAIFPEHGRTPLELIDAARHALAQASKQGGNKVVMADAVAPPLEEEAPAGDGVPRPQSDAPASWDALASEQPKN
ncbi:MAG: GGDEF domain-containing protein [Candidatus Eremiobacterota bacterium]